MDVAARQARTQTPQRILRLSVQSMDRHIPRTLGPCLAAFRPRTRPIAPPAPPQGIGLHFPAGAGSANPRPAGLLVPVAAAAVRPSGEPQRVARGRGGALPRALAPARPLSDPNASARPRQVSLRLPGRSAHKRAERRLNKRKPTRRRPQ
uniref:Uncharacterized protein n=1 Tax=viral metagenome TaxID=1070528 RepID=A0A6M3KBX5_9ZZZZ